MYNIYYSLKDEGWVGHDIVACVNTELMASMVAVREMRRVLRATTVKLLPLSEMEFVIWSFGRPQGYLSIKEVGPVT